MSKAAKRQRKKQGRRDRIEAATKAARRRRQRNLNIGMAVVAVALIAFVAISQATKKKTTTKVTTGGTPTSTATPSSTASAAAGGSVACGATKPPANSTPAITSPPTMTVSASKTYTATMKTSCGTVVMTLDAKDSPNTVNSFAFLADKGFYNGLTFHRLSTQVKIIQGGDPKGDGTGGVGYSVKDPVPAGVQYTPGTVAMAKTQNDPDGTAGSQFFIVTDATSPIGPNYAVLGHVTSGQDVVNKIGALPIQGGAADGPPAQPVYIESVTIAIS